MTTRGRGWGRGVRKWEPEASEHVRNGDLATISYAELCKRYEEDTGTEKLDNGQTWNCEIWKNGYTTSGHGNLTVASHGEENRYKEKRKADESSLCTLITEGEPDNSQDVTDGCVTLATIPGLSKEKIHKLIASEVNKCTQGYLFNREKITRENGPDSSKIDPKRERETLRDEIGTSSNIKLAAVECQDLVLHRKKELGTDFSSAIHHDNGIGFQHKDRIRGIEKPKTDSNGKISFEDIQLNNAFPQELMNFLSLSKKQSQVPPTWTLVSIDLKAKLIQAMKSDEQRIKKCKVVLYQSLLIQMWTKHNEPLFEIVGTIEDHLLEALQVFTGQVLPAFPLGIENDLETLAVDLFLSTKLRNCFMETILCKLIPRPPKIQTVKIAVLTNFDGNGIVHVKYYDKTSRSLQTIIQTVQKTYKVYGPDNLTDEECISLVQKVGIKHVLAPVKGDWANLHRVKIIGYEIQTLVVKVLYVDLGKEECIPMKNLAFSLVGKLPELADKMHPLATKITVYNENVENNSLFNKFGPKFEGRVCYVQTIEESYYKCPKMKLYIANPRGTGCSEMMHMLQRIADPDLTLVENHSLDKCVLKSTRDEIQQTNDKWKVFVEKQRTIYPKLDETRAEESACVVPAQVTLT